MSEAQDVFTTSDRRAAEVLRVLERARGNLATPDSPTLRATVEPHQGEVAVRLMLSTANPAAEAAAGSLVASGHALESLVVPATQRLADLQHAEERILHELSESVQALRRQTEVLLAWRARLGSLVAAWGLILALFTGTGIAVAWRSREVALRTQGVLEQILENQAQLQAVKAKGQAARAQTQAGKAGRRP
jgi:hypothetical protein